MAFLPGWQKFIGGTIAAVDMPSALAGFPVAVKISTASGLTDQDVSAVFDEIGAAWQKVAFQLGESASESYAELEFWDSVNEAGLFHVKFDLASGENKFRMYYDSTHADNTAYIGAVTSTAAQAVWDSDTVRRYGLNQDPTGGAGCIKDSTANAGHGTPSGTWASDKLITSDYGKGLLFSNIGYITVPDANDLTPTATGFTVETFFYPTSLSPSPTRVVGKMSNPYEWAINMWDNNGTIQYQNCNGSSSNAEATERVNKLAINNFYYLAGTSDSIGKTGLYINGVLEAESSNSYMPANTSSTVTIGYNLTGKIYEVRISKVKRSDAWLLATYKSLTDTLITYSDEQLTQTYGINGVVKAGGDLYPGSKVLLIDRVTLDLVSVRTAAEITAEYSFTGLQNGDAGRYGIHIIDPTNTYNDVAVSAITAVEE